MARLDLPQQAQSEKDAKRIKEFLASVGVFYERWPLLKVPKEQTAQTDFLKLYEAQLGPFMARGGYQVADVIVVGEDHPDHVNLRQKFLREHTHTEDEIRFFVSGQGLFWFHIGEQVFSLLCEAGDVISVPAQTKHWFDLGPKPDLVAIRIFTDKAGWVPHYTNSGIEALYQKLD